MSIRNQVIRCLGIFSLGAGLTFWSTHYDYEWTMKLWREQWQPLTTWMAQSVFEGENPGFSDLGVIIPIVALFLWIYAWINRGEFSIAYQRALALVVCSSVVGPFLVAQSLKSLVTRARPRTFMGMEGLSHLDVMSTGLFPGFVGLFEKIGHGWNSFPSGHTASVSALLALGYISFLKKSAKVVIICCVVALSFVMGVSRSMAGMHWISDSIASFFLMWIVVELLSGYFNRTLSSKHQ